MAQKLNRNINIGFRVNEDEHFFLKKHMEEAGWDNLRQFVMHQVVRGKIVKFEPQELTELSRLLRTVSNNVNQIAVRANSNGRVYMDELDYIKENQQKLWEKLNELLKAVAKAQEVDYGRQ
jgi:valyl-tRNA synthetase